MKENDFSKHEKKKVQLKVEKITKHISKFDFEENDDEVCGKWEYSPKDDIVICSKCKNEHYLGTYRQFASNYCPNCGMKMESIN